MDNELSLQSPYSLLNNMTSRVWCISEFDDTSMKITTSWFLPKNYMTDKLNFMPKKSLSDSEIAHTSSLQTVDQVRKRDYLFGTIATL